MSDLSGDLPVELDPPEQIVLRASVQRWIWVLLGSVIFVFFGAGIALGIGASGAAQITGWVLVALFGPCAVVAFRQLLTPGSLVLTVVPIESATMDLIGRRRRMSVSVTYMLAECGEFAAWRSPTTGSVAVVFDSPAADAKPMAEQNRAAMGATDSLSDTFGLGADELVDLLNDVRTAALDARAGSVS